MRTSLELPDVLFEKAKRLAAARRATLRELVIEGLELVMAQEHEHKTRGYKLRDASFGQGGLCEGLSEADFSRIRDLAYEGRGG